MTREQLRDKTLDWIDIVFDGVYLKGACWVVITVAALYFIPVAIRILTR